MLSSIYCVAVPQAQHSAKQVRADQSATTQASRQRASTWYCTAVSEAQHSTAQQSVRTKTKSKYVPVRVRHREQADKSRREPAQFVEHLYGTLSSRNEQRNQNVPGLQQDTATSYYYCRYAPFSPSFLCTFSCMRRPGCFPSMEFLTFASRQFAPKIVDLCVRFIRIFLFYSSLSASVAGGRKPPAERSALSTIPVRRMPGNCMQTLCMISDPRVRLGRGKLTKTGDVCSAGYTSIPRTPTVQLLYLQD